MTKKKLGICTYCGTVALLTLDHVVPRCLFIPPLPGNLPKVQACARCKGTQKSSEDRYLRDMLISDCATQHHRVAQHLAVKYAQSIKRRQSRLARVASAKPRKVVEEYTPGGLYLGPAYVVDLPDEQIISILTRLVRGLYYARCPITLPGDAQFEVLRIRDPRGMLPFVQDMVRTRVAKNILVGNGDVFNFTYAPAYDTVHPHAGLWFLGFYEHVVFSVAIRSLSLASPAGP